MQVLHSTIGEQRLHNAAVQIKTKEEFIAWDTADLPPAPGYFPEVVRLNKFGGELVADLAARAKTVTCEEAARLREVPGTVVVDLRDADDFAAVHIKGSLNFPLGADDGAVLRPQDGNFGIWVGTILSPKTPLLLVCTLGREVEAVQRLARVGFENVVGVLTESGPVSALSPLWEAGCMPLESHVRHIWVRYGLQSLRCVRLCLESTRTPCCGFADGCVV
jgi:hydroxyacylglutathione hydrolase